MIMNILVSSILWQKYGTCILFTLGILLLLFFFNPDFFEYREMASISDYEARDLDVPLF